jgi:hypothetical protein
MFFAQTVQRDRDSWHPDPMPAWGRVLRFLVLGFVSGGVVGWLAGYVVGLKALVGRTQSRCALE